MVFGTSANTLCLSAALETVSAVIERVTIAAETKNFLNFMLELSRRPVSLRPTVVVFLGRPRVPVNPLNPTAVSSIKKRSFAAEQFTEIVNRNGQNDDGADEDPLPIRINAEEQETVAQHF